MEKKDKDEGRENKNAKKKLLGLTTK